MVEAVTQVVERAPEISWTKTSGLRTMKRLSCLIILCGLLSEHAFLHFAIMAIILVTVITWLLSRFGLEGLSPLPIIFAATWGGIRSPNPRLRPCMEFRSTGPRGHQSLRLVGFDAGVQLDDRIRAVGPQVAGTIRVLWMKNLTTGTIFLRRGLLTASILSLVDVVALSHGASWTVGVFETLVGRIV